MAAVLRLLPQQLGLKGKDVIEHPIDAPALEPVIGDDAGVLEVAAERSPERAVDARLAADLGLLEQLQAPIERELPRLMGREVHSVPSTSMRPA
ncbi:MAG TPA: hypothetical protein VG364_07460, partial [Candidatus Dormibacteraeota bacterium]|nr:hypothetical protein [Candidatus Dormibacteraeota bacterium]